MARLSSQGSIINISNPVDTVQDAIASATKAKPAAITVVATPPVVGDIVVPRNTGWNSIEGMPFKVSAVLGMVVTLEDSDTTGEVAAINITTGKLSNPTFMELCRSTFTANQPAGATIDVTTLCDNAHRLVNGLPAIGTWTAAGFFDSSDTALTRAKDCYRSGEKTVIDVILPDGTGWCFMALINTYDVGLGINAAVTNTVGGQMDGLVHFYKTPPAGWVAPFVAGAVAPPARTAEPARAAA